MLLLVGVVAVATVVAIPETTSGFFRKVLCELQNLVGSGSGECEDLDGQADSDYDYTPVYCPVEGETQTYGGTIDIAFLSFGEEYSFVRESMADGRVRVTFVPTTEVGVQGGVGWDFGKDDSISTDARIDGGVSAKLASGVTYLFDSEEEYQEFQGEVERAISEELERQIAPEVDLLKSFGDLVGVYERPEITVDPAVRTQTLEIEGHIDAQVGAWTRPATKGEGSWNLNMGAQGNVTVSGKMDHSTWYTDPDNVQTSEIYTFTGSGNLGATYLGAHAAGELSWSGGTRIMRNEDGSLANIRYTTVAEGAFNLGVDFNIEQENNGTRGGGVDGGRKHTNSVTQMVQIDFDTPEEQEIGERLLEERGLLPPENAMDSMANPLMDDPDGGEINAEPETGAPEWERLLFEKGRAWQYAADAEEEHVELSAKLKMGLQFGASVYWANEERHTTNAQYLDAPEDGNRRFIDYPDCVSERASGEE
ncbi:hypothetical protein [Allosalinactinospora lopnorensis]|uniref:hypothetical protein n=1 Tax=Allosalinactinospora lopnorensis TaxID=1352348 RepID=UPI001F302FC1|nr:hypothetical protein [Allosalinactinospora lopnorensis]